MDGKVRRVRGNFMDITDKKRMELELQLANDMLENRVANRTRELARANRDMNQILSSISSILFAVGNDGQVNKWNNSATQILRQKQTVALGRPFEELQLCLDTAPLEDGMEKCRQDKLPVKLHNLHYQNNEGKKGFLAFTINPILTEAGELEGCLFLGEDITELKVLESQLSQAQRLEAIGQLAAGIAHEINTPIQYIGDSVTFLHDAFVEVQSVLERCKQLEEKENIPHEAYVILHEAVSAALADIDYAFLQVEIPKSFNRVLEGIDRVSTIVAAMKRFSHPGGQEKRAVDINSAVESTLTVSHNEWKYVAELTTDLSPELPSVICFPGDLNQVLLNIIINAANAISDVVGDTQNKGRIGVVTRLEGEQVVISISDTGTGIPAGVREKIFDPFFTTKEVGKGSGQGLAIAYDIVVNKHGGSITFETEPGQGTTFFIRLPIGG
jgi:PAS domain S-box-containing protein